MTATTDALESVTIKSEKCLVAACGKPAGTRVEGLDDKGDIALLPLCLSCDDMGLGMNGIVGDPYWVPAEFEVGAGVRYVGTLEEFRGTHAVIIEVDPRGMVRMVTPTGAKFQARPRSLEFLAPKRQALNWCMHDDAWTVLGDWGVLPGTTRKRDVFFF